MTDPYKDVFDTIAKALNEHTKMISWIAERTLSVKDFKEFVDEFSKKTTDKSTIADWIKEEGR